jgi:hypothetical protein
MRSNLTGETGWSADKRVHLVIAHRLSAISKIEPEFFYTLLRENRLLNVDSAARARFVINMQTERKPLIYDIALLDHKRDPQVSELGYSSAWHSSRRTGKTAGCHSKAR